MNAVTIKQKAGNFYEFSLNGEVVMNNKRNDLTVIRDLSGNYYCHFKTANGANIFKIQNILVSEVTLEATDGSQSNPTTVNALFTQLTAIGYFAWILGGSGGGSGASRFNDLLDTFGYVGNNGKVPVVDEMLLKLVPVTLFNYRMLTDLEDVAIPALNSNMANMVVSVGMVDDQPKFVLTNPGETPIENPTLRGENKVIELILADFNITDFAELTPAMIADYVNELEITNIENYLVDVEGQVYIFKDITGTSADVVADNVAMIVPGDVASAPEPNLKHTATLAMINEELGLSLTMWSQATEVIKAQYISAVIDADAEDYYIVFEGDSDTPVPIATEEVIILDAAVKSPFICPTPNVLTTAWQYVIPANTIPENCVIIPDIRISKPDGSVASGFLGVYNGDTRLGQSQIAAGSKYIRCTRKMVLKAGSPNLRVINVAELQPNDNGNFNNGVDLRTFDRTVNNTISIRITSSNNTDQHIFEYFELRVIKQKV